MDFDSIVVNSFFFFFYTLLIVIFFILYYFIIIYYFIMILLCFYVIFILCIVVLFFFMYVFIVSFWFLMYFLFLFLLFFLLVGYLIIFVCYLLFNDISVFLGWSFGFILCFLLVIMYTAIFLSLTSKDWDRRIKLWLHRQEGERSFVESLAFYKDVIFLFLLFFLLVGYLIIFMYYLFFNDIFVFLGWSFGFILCFLLVIMYTAIFLSLTSKDWDRRIKLWLRKEDKSIFIKTLLFHKNAIWVKFFGGWRR